MNKSFFVLPVSLLSLLIALPGVAADNEHDQNTVKSDIPNLNEIELPVTNAELLTQQPGENEVKTEPKSESDLKKTELD